MNIEHKPQVSTFLQQLSHGEQRLFCPICGRTIELVNSSENRISALCTACDFHATVPNQMKA